MENKRNYVRIKDLLSLAYQKMDAKSYAQVKEYFPAGIECSYEGGEGILAFEPSTEIPWEEIEKADPYLASAFKALDRKLNLVLDLLRHLCQERPLQELNLSVVEISGSGIRFKVKEPFEIEDILKVRLLLPGKVYHPVTFYGRVVRVDPEPLEETEGDEETGGGLYLSLEYDLIQDDDVERIVRYIFFKQREALKVRRADSLRREQTELP